MKKLILPFLIFLSFNQIATAGTCDTKLTQKKSYSYKTINQTFTCLNNQINLRILINLNSDSGRT